MEILAKRLKELRLQHGFKQKEVAQSLGLSISAYCRYEYGEREPQASMLAKMADFYKVTTDHLLGREM